MDYVVKVASWITVLYDMLSLLGNFLDFSIGKSDAEVTYSLSPQRKDALKVFEADNFLQRGIS